MERVQSASVTWALPPSHRDAEAPPYSPTATTDERGHLPHDYVHHTIDDRDLDGDPLQSLTRPNTNNSVPSSRGYGSASSSSSRPVSHSNSSSTTSVYSGLSQYAATSFIIPSALLSDTPPSYSACDTLARSFRLQGNMIYATKTSNTPRYQLMQEFSRSGEPRRLHIRRLMAAESRAHSLSDPTYPTGHAACCPRPIPYDPEATMYTMLKLSSLSPRPSKSAAIEMRGLRSSTIGGIITLEQGKSVFGKKWVKVWHKTKLRRRDSLNPENEERLRRWGYHADDEWERECLFVCKKKERRKMGKGKWSGGGDGCADDTGGAGWKWVDGEGKKVAFEEDGEDMEKRFELLGVQEGWKKDLLISCWIMRAWADGLRWEGDVEGR